MNYIRTMFGFGGRPFIDGTSIYYLYTNALLFIMLIICSTPIPKKVFKRLKDNMNSEGVIIIPTVYMFLIFLCTAYLVNESYNPFLYFRF